MSARMQCIPRITVTIPIIYLINVYSFAERWIKLQHSINKHCDLSCRSEVEGMDVLSLVFVVCCVDGGLCDELITFSKESCWVCVSVCNLETSTMKWPMPEVGLLCH
jgi:hypothetical protein